MSKALEHALRYADTLGDVFPLNGKVPATPRGFKDASRDPEQIRAWFEGRTDRNVGIAIPDGHVVLDVDPRKGGDKTLSLIRDQLPASTLVTKTGRGDGGLHLWFKGEVPRVKLPGIDVKRHGKGYVVAPPSVHPDTGGEYEWVNWGSPVAAIEGPIRLAVPPSAGADVWDILGTSGAAREAAESVEPILIGQQHDTLLEIAGHALAKYPPRIARMVYDAALARCEPPHPAGQAESVWGWVSQRQEDGEGYVSDESVTIDGEMAPDGERRFTPIDWHELMTGDIPEPEWLCEPLLEAKRQVALYSDAKAGKSLLVLDAACGIATGKATLGNPGRDPRPVVYIDLENTADDIRERVEKLGYGWQELTGRLWYYSFPSLHYLDTREGGQEVYGLAVEHGAALVVIDTLSRVTEGDENENDTYLNFYKHTGVPLKRASIALVRLDHAGKDARKGMRGASAKTTDVDSVWSLVADGNVLTLERTHSRNAHGASRLMLDRVDSPGPRVAHVVRADTLEEIFGEAEPVPEGSRSIEEIISLLDEIGFPPSSGVRAARDALRNAGYKVISDRAIEAQKQRKFTSAQPSPSEGDGGTSTKVEGDGLERPLDRPLLPSPSRPLAVPCIQNGQDGQDEIAESQGRPPSPSPSVSIGHRGGDGAPDRGYKPYVVPFDLGAYIDETADWKAGDE